ncbi:MAG TPA: hypothetical protein VGR06_35050 [Actinophytocola sp.]|uniref:hypothetical protein n=1 Tax=Actinophytocola sp. TaxID=1872138 RepID=UPI002E0B0208|nr:hypothetical protein [Actinophytocola sp.]
MTAWRRIAATALPTGRLALEGGRGLVSRTYLARALIALLIIGGNGVITIVAVGVASLWK